MEYSSKVLKSFYASIFSTFRRKFHFTQKPIKNCLDKIQEFLSCNIKLRSKNSYVLDAIENMDGNPPYLNMPTSATVQTMDQRK